MSSLDAEQLHISVTGETSVVVSWLSPGAQVADLLIRRADGIGSASPIKATLTNSPLRSTAWVIA